MPEFRMPVLGADMDEGTVLEWMVKPGDEIHKGDVIAAIDTAKSAIDVESSCSGVIDQLIIGVGQTVPVGTVLATISGPGQGQRPAAAGAGRSAPAATPTVRRRARELGVELGGLRGTGRGGAITRNDVERAAPAPAAPSGARRQVTPRARRVAAELGVDLDLVTGAGPSGEIREADVRRAGPAPGAERPPASRARSTRQAIARLMARSSREIPHYYVSNTADMTNAMSWLRDRNRELEVAARLVPAALLIKATALAARRLPQLNGFWEDDQFQPADAVNVGLAISLRGGGLLTPAIAGTDRLTLDELMARMRDLVIRARSGRLRGSELTDGTITVTNLGDQGVESVFGVIYPPQVALAGFGRVTERPVAVNGLVGARPVVVTTLAADHRATDGYAGGRFLAMISDLLQRPGEL